MTIIHRSAGTPRYPTLTCNCYGSRAYVSGEKSEDKRMNNDVEGLQLVSEDQDIQLGSDDTVLCPLEATESWSDVQYVHN